MFIVKDTGQKIDNRGRTFRNKIDYDLFQKRKCVLCDKNILSSETALIEEKENMIFVSCKLDYKEYKSVVCWNCRPPHSMNTNSIKYNVIKFGLTEDQALELIHNRNKSPFYKTSFSDYEDYRKFQAHSDFSEERKQEIQKKQDIGRQLWAKKLGKEALKKIKDSSSLDFHIKKYGEELGRIKFNEKGQKCRGSTIDEIRTVEQKRQHLLSQYHISNEEDLIKWFRLKHSNRSILSTLYFLERTKLDKQTIPIHFGKIVFDIDNIYDFFGVSHLREFIEKRVRHHNKGFTYNGIIDGHYLRSGKEITFYKLLDDNDIKIVKTNQSYPNSGRNFYDFLVDINGIMYYIEIIGDERNEYKEKLLLREEKYGSILIHQKYFAKFLKDAKSNDVKRGEYHDWK